MLEPLIADFAQIVEFVSMSIEKLLSPAWYQQNAVALFNVLLIDLVLAGDNAIVVGLAASRVDKSIRSKVIFWGITAAVVLRILFASITIQLLAVVGLTLAGGLLLLFVCWKMYRQIKSDEAAHDIDATANMATKGAKLGFWGAVWQITLADVAMSLDNVLAVAGAAKDEPLVLVIGLAIAVVLMAIAAHFIARLLVNYPWITWLGLLVILWVALDMIYAGSHQVSCAAYDLGCSQTLWDAVKNRLGFLPGVGG